MSESFNPLLDRLRMPGATYKLPSQGVFYEKGELDDSVKNGEVEIYPMTAIDEIILNTPDKLISGKAIAEVFQRCIPQIVKPFDLLAQDVDFLMVALRAVSFGDEMEISYKHDCEGSLNQSYQVNLQDIIRATKVVDPTVKGTEYQHVLPNGQIVVLQPLSYGNIVELYQTTAMSKTKALTNDEAEKVIIGTLVAIIARVDDVVNKDHIREWVRQLPLGWKQQVQLTAQSVTQWGVELSTHKVCKDCKQPMTIPITANPVSFFT